MSSASLEAVSPDVSKESCSRKRETLFQSYSHLMTDLTMKHTLSYPYLGFKGMTSPFFAQPWCRRQQPPLKSQSRQVSD